MAPAVPEAVGQLGILERCLRLVQGSRARCVPWADYDACAAALVDTLGAVEGAHLADRVFGVRRGAEAALEVLQTTISALTGTACTRRVRWARCSPNGSDRGM
ncbi:hypothetical protein [Streptomyces sp. NPDC048196]|uniref:hypothetical protein n=1 Tax=Streptomyces sp. NPDC048196 TaxID=3154712 RepID=UPI0034002C2C